MNPAPPKKNFCTICYPVGASVTVYTSHSISSCKFLTQADQSDLSNLLVIGSLFLTDEQESRLQAYAAPGWNIDDTDSDSNETDIDTQDINLESYPHTLCYVMFI